MPVNEVNSACIGNFFVRYIRNRATLVSGLQTLDNPLCSRVIAEVEGANMPPPRSITDGLLVRSIFLLQASLVSLLQNSLRVNSNACFVFFASNDRTVDLNGQVLFWIFRGYHVLR